MRLRRAQEVVIPIQDEIIAALGVSASFDARREAAERAAFLRDYLRSSGQRAYVLGISGGVDSLTAGLIAQSAVKDLRQIGYECEFVAVRLPYGEQMDERDAQLALSAIRPDRVAVINIKPATDALWSGMTGLITSPPTPACAVRCSGTSRHANGWSPSLLSRGPWAAL